MSAGAVVSRAGRPSGDKHAEDGFTLVELLVVCAVIPLVIGAISVALISVLTQQNAVANKIADTGDATVVSANFVKDVQSAAQITTYSTLNPTLSPPVCGPNSGTAVPILSLEFGLPTTSPTFFPPVVSYDVVSENARGSRFGLYRDYCTNGTSASSTPTDSTLVSHDVQKALGALIGGESCNPTTLKCVANPVWSSGWQYTSGVSGVSINVNSSLSSYHFTLTGAPRVSTPASRGNKNPPGHPTLLTLGSGSPGVSCGGSGSITVTGTATIDSTGAPAASTNGGAKIKATQIYTGAPTNPNPLSGNITPTTPTGQGTALDPYVGLPPPATGLLTATLTPGSTYQGYHVYSGTYQGPGIYTGQLTSYPSNPQTFASGVYILMNGIRDNAQQAINSAAGGVLLYVVRGQVDLEGGGGLTISPFSTPPAGYTGAPSPWVGIVIWQDGPGTQSATDAGDNVALKLTGGAAESEVNGTIYAPDASVGGGGNAALNASSVVAAGVSCNGGGTINIG